MRTIVTVKVQTYFRNLRHSILKTIRLLRSCCWSWQATVNTWHTQLWHARYETIFKRRKQYYSILRCLGGASHLMSPLQPPSNAYGSVPGVPPPPSPYGHPYGSAHHQISPMHGLPHGHASAASAHMHALHQQAQQQNPHMMSVQNGPVILVSNLNENVSWNKEKEEKISWNIPVSWKDKIETSFISIFLSTSLSHSNFWNLILSIRFFFIFSFFLYFSQPDD